MPDDLRIGSHMPAIDTPASTPSSPASPHSTPGSRPPSPRPSSTSHSASAFGRLGHLRDVNAARPQRANASPRAGQTSGTSGAAHSPPATPPSSPRPSKTPHDARFNYGRHDVPSFKRSHFFGFPRPLRTRFSAPWPQSGGNEHFNRGFNWGASGGFGGGFGGGIGRFAMPAVGMFLGADLGMMAGAALGADFLMPGCFMPGLDLGLGLLGGAALGALGWEAGRMFNRFQGGQSSGTAYQAHYTHPPYGGSAEPPVQGYAQPYGASHTPYASGMPVQGYAPPPQYVPTYPAYTPYPAYGGGYGGGPGWGSMFAGAALGGLGFGIGEAIGADLMFDMLI